jgi:hypothetical protein
MGAAPVRKMSRRERLGLAPPLVRHLRLGSSHEGGQVADSLVDRSARFVDPRNQLALLVVRRPRGLHRMRP